MIVPEYWAEARLKHRKAGRQITMRRFGWSDESQADAQANADARVNEALERTLSGEDLPRSEPKVPYNGGVGVPIREEIVNRYGDTVVTRNSYGALCLNTPSALFADVDFAFSTPMRFWFIAFALLSMCAVAVGLMTGLVLLGLALVFVAALMAAPLIRLVHKLIESAKGGPEQAALKRVARFADAHRSWSLRVYRTPAGLRVLATHRLFEHDDPEVKTFFDALGTDPIYALMCANQQCFRARVSPKPWRIGVHGNIKPRRGVWPVRPEHLKVRSEWISAYEAKAEGYAACRFLESVGKGSVHRELRSIVDLHDSLCRATVAGLPIA